MDPTYFAIALAGMLISVLSAFIVTIKALSAHFQSKEGCLSFREGASDREKHMTESVERMERQMEIIRHEAGSADYSIFKMLREIVLHLPIDDEKKVEILNQNGSKK